MKAFQRWAKDKNPFLAVTCHQYAKFPIWIYALLDTAQDDLKYGKDMNQPDLDTWLSLYKDHRSIQSALFGFGSFPGGIFEVDENVVKQVSDYEDKTTDEIFSTIFNVSDGYEYLESYVAALRAKPVENEPDNKVEEFQAYFEKAEVYFLMRVYLPSWLHYGQLPGQLLRQARLGNMDSLEKLLRLDSSVIFDRKIAENFHQIRTKKRAVFERLSNAILLPPKGKITLQKMKVFIAGYISVISGVFGERLTGPQIRALFDAIAKDEGKGDIDTDLPESAETFYMAIYREHPFWETALEAYKI